MTAIREIEPADGPALLAFARALPDEEVSFFKSEQVTSPDVAAWATHAGARRLLALDEAGAIVGYAAVLPGFGLTRHVGELLLVIGADQRGMGLGRKLARAAMIASFAELGLTKLTVEVVADQDATVRMFTRMGFAVEALLRDHLRAPDGELRDLVILSHLVEENWSELQILGIPQAL